MTNNLDLSYEYKLKSLPRGGDSLTPVAFSCNKPHRVVTVDLNSNCFLCTCDGHLPIPVGQVQDFDTLESVWDSPIAKMLQEDIDAKKFTWCAVEHCGVRNQNIFQPAYQLAINIDESCNLHCPSCRRDPIMHTAGIIVEKKLQDVNRIMLWLEKFDKPIHIVLTGNGDPLASTIIRPLIKNYLPKLNQTFRLFTNGLLIKKQLPDSPLLPNITEFSISVDAGSAEVYEKVRLGGSWKVLLENFEYIKTLPKKKINLNFAVQNNNWHDLPNFVNLCLSYGFSANIHQLDDWGTWNKELVETPDVWTIANGTFLDHDVLSQTHVNHNKCKDLIKELIKQCVGKPMYFSPRLLQLLEL